MIKITRISKRLKNEKIIILVDGWSSYESLYYLMRKSIPNDFGYIQYAYPNEILCPNPEKTRNNFMNLINRIKKDLISLNDKKPRKFYFYGQSLGGLFCMIVSDQITVEKIMLIVPGYNLAEAFWLGTSTQGIKEEMIKQSGITLPKLKKIWEDISPDYYFKNKSLDTDFTITLSKTDKLIPIANGKRLIKFLKEENVKEHVSWTHLPHQLEMLKEGLFTDRFKKWVRTLK